MHYSKANDQLKTDGLFSMTTQYRLIVLLSLTVLSQIVFSLHRPGNLAGMDEWMFIYGVSHGTVSFVSNRLLDLLPNWAAYHLVGSSAGGIHTIHFVAHVLTAYFLFLLICELDANSRDFAYACSVIYVGYIVFDIMLLLSFWMMLLVIYRLIALVALYFFARFITSTRWWMFAISAAGLVVLLLMGEFGMAFLPGAAVLIFISKRQFTKQRIIGLAIWLTICGLVVVQRLLPVLGIQQSTYGSSLVGDFSLGSIIKNTLVQFSYAFFKPSIPNTPIQKIVHFQLPSMAAVLVLGISLWLIHSSLQQEENQIPVDNRPFKYVLWYLAGLSITFLTFAPYLITLYAAIVSRIHMLPAPAEAVTLAGLLWFVGHLTKSKPFRWAIQYAGVAFIFITGLTRVGQLQYDMQYLYGISFEANAAFLRTMSNQIPDVEDHTLFVLIEQPDLPQSPFTHGASFQYAIKYLYDDKATGLIPTDTLLGYHPEITDEAICIVPDNLDAYWLNPHPEESCYRGDEIIFLTKIADGSALILDELPEGFHSPEREMSYAPYDRIKPGFVPDRLGRYFPPYLVMGSR